MTGRKQMVPCWCESEGEGNEKAKQSKGCAQTAVCGLCTRPWKEATCWGTGSAIGSDMGSAMGSAMGFGMGLAVGFGMRWVVGSAKRFGMGGVALQEAAQR